MKKLLLLLALAACAPGPTAPSTCRVYRPGEPIPVLPPEWPKCKQVLP